MILSKKQVIELIKRDFSESHVPGIDYDTVEEFVEAQTEDRQVFLFYCSYENEEYRYLLDIQDGVPSIYQEAFVQDLQVIFECYHRKLHPEAYYDDYEDGDYIY